MLTEFQRLQQAQKETRAKTNESCLTTLSVLEETKGIDKKSLDELNRLKIEFEALIEMKLEEDPKTNVDLLQSAAKRISTEIKCRESKH